MALNYTRQRLSSAQREALYDRCCGDARFPTCNIPGCGRPVKPGEAWVESHFPVPHALGGTETGVAHDLCNRIYAGNVEVPAIAKAKRVRRKYVGAHVAQHPLPCGRNSSRKKTIDGRVVARPPRGKATSRVLFINMPVAELDRILDVVNVEMKLP
jgi:hypothetical protein